MGAAHTRGLYRPGSGPVYALPAHVKIVAVVAFVFAVVATPATAFPAFALHAGLILIAVRAARLPAGFVLRRLTVELPFVAFALALPFFAAGERIVVYGLTLSEPGLVAAWNILAKGTLGVAAAVVLAATTRPYALLEGLQRLRVPSIMVQIATFMLRYADLLTDDLRRMRIARESRAFTARHLGHARIVAAGAGSLFIRGYERGERVHLAMLSRGYTGTLPDTGTVPATRRDWLFAAALPLLGALIAAGALLGAA
ncbi:MAG: cobalt ECF transporter T component CbiQ [Streptosporangiales bacterium]|nr:cobalt ECF transporter T component CbiQ [Streptosporangiales bacterium]